MYVHFAQILNCGSEGKNEDDINAKKESDDHDNDDGAASIASDVRSVDDIADAILGESSRPEGLGEEQWMLVVSMGREAARAKKVARAAQRTKRARNINSMI